MRTMWQRARRQSLPAFASYGPTVCLCACLYVWEICNGTVGNKNTKQAVVFGWPATKQEEDCDETKQKRYNQAKLESEVRTKERTNVFRFSVFCRLKRKKGVLSLSLFSPVVAPSQKRATSFLCDSCERPSRTPVLLLACNLSIVCLSSMLPVTWLPLFST